MQDDAFTHIISHIDFYQSSDTLQVLKNAYYALIPKGIALVTGSQEGSVQRILAAVAKAGGSEAKPVLQGVSNDASVCPTQDELRDLAEEAQFERGKIRWSARKIVITGDEVQKLKSSLQAGVQDDLSECEEGQGWKKEFDEAFRRETDQHGGLVVEAWLMVAMRWDLLTA